VNWIYLAETRDNWQTVVKKIVTPWKRVWQADSLLAVINLTSFMGPECSLPCSQEPVIAPNPEPDESRSVLLHTMYLRYILIISPHILVFEDERRRCSSVRTVIRLWTFFVPKFRYRVHKSAPLDTTISLLNPLHNLTSQFHITIWPVHSEIFTAINVTY
jgi:hypothetical protein